MAYVAPIHKPTSIRHALSIELFEDDRPCLTFAKCNRLEVWRFETDNTPVLLHTKLVYGTITLLQRLRPKGAKTDLLFVGTERQEYFTLAWDAGRQQLVNGQAIHDQSEPIMRDSECHNKCVVDPSGKFVVLHLWEGVINISRLQERGELKDQLKFIEQVNLRELFIKSSTFLHSQTGPRIAFLYQSRIDEEDAKLVVYRLTADDRHMTAAKFEPKEKLLDLVVPDKLAKLLIPVPIVEDDNKRYHVRNATSRRAHLGGVLVIGETSVLYVDSQDWSMLEAALPEGNIFVAWAACDVTRYFLADDFGRLHLLTLETDGVVVTGITVNQLGSVITPVASTLVYLGYGLLFVGSHYGNSQFVQVDVDSGDIGLLSSPPSFYNNAPILDFVIMDMGNREGDEKLGNTFSSGQARIVAGCGVHEAGSLRSIRSGVGIDDVGVLDDFKHVRGVFTLKSPGAAKMDTILVSTLTETRAFKLDQNGEMEEQTSSLGLRLDQETLHASDLPTGHLLQVTRSAVRLSNPRSGALIARWNPPKVATDSGSPHPGVITSVSANENWALLLVNGTTLVSLDLRNQLRAVVKTGGVNEQISCVHASPSVPNLGVVGFWKPALVVICDLKTLNQLHSEAIPLTEDSASFPRDAALVQLHPRALSPTTTTLLVSMEDGNVITYNVDKTGFGLSGRKTVILGTEQARLHALPGEEGVTRVFATTENASLIHSSEGRVVFSAATAEDAIYVAPFDCEVYPNSIVIANDTQIRISSLDTERRTQVKPFLLGRTVRRLAYSPTLRAFVLGSIKRGLSTGEETVATQLFLVDEVVFQTLGDQFVLNPVSGVELPECVIRAELPDAQGNIVERFIVGTSVSADPRTGHPSLGRGRILVLGVDSDRRLYQVLSHPLNGACKSLGVTADGTIMAALSASVVAYRYVELSSTKARLESRAKYRVATHPQDMSISGNLVGVSDVVKSLTVVEYRDDEEKPEKRFVERAVHAASAWPTAVSHIGGGSWLEAGASGNLLVLRQPGEGLPQRGATRMEATNALNLGEQVNQIRPLNIASSNKDVISPRAFLATVDGGVYLFGTISPQYQSLLINFQNRLADFVEQPGMTSFLRWRAPRLGDSDWEGPKEFVDGEFLELFLDMSEGMQDAVCDGLGPSVEVMRNLVEELRRLH